MNDSILHKQLHDTEEYANALKNICKFYHTPFSFEVMQGGYIYGDGEYIEETTLHITMIDQSDETVNKIADDLCYFFNQESVLVTQSIVNMYYVRGDNEIRNILKSSCENN